MEAAEVFSSLLAFIEERLKKKHMPDPELVKAHNADPLSKDWQIPTGQLWEQSDVVHDLLAFLAEQMIELNKPEAGQGPGVLGLAGGRVASQARQEREQWP